LTILDSKGDKKLVNIKWADLKVSNAFLNGWMDGCKSSSKDCCTAIKKLE
jgi:hypothetical protein